MTETINQKSSINKEQIVWLASNLFEEAVSANSYFRVLQQFKKNAKEHNEELKLSPAFYNTIYQALKEVLFLTLSRIYDNDSKSLGIDKLLNWTRKPVLSDLHHEVKKTFEENKNVFIHNLTPAEEVFFPEESKEIQELRNLFKLHNIPVTMKMTGSAINKLYRRRLTTLRASSAEALRNRRNQMIAHNDAETNFKWDELCESFPLSECEIKDLIDFAIDCSQFYVGIYTGVHKHPEFLNINDWDTTLWYVQIGRKYLESCDDITLLND